MIMFVRHSVGWHGRSRPGNITGMKNGTITEADILTEVIHPDRPDLPPEFARTILDLKFSPSATDRMNELTEKNRLGTLMAAERGDVEKYLRVGNFLNLLQAKARLSLKDAEPPVPPPGPG
jgi:hypothetical protein